MPQGEYSLPPLAGYTQSHHQGYPQTPPNHNTNTDTPSTLSRLLLELEFQFTLGTATTKRQEVPSAWVLMARLGLPAIFFQGLPLLGRSLPPHTSPTLKISGRRHPMADGAAGLGVASRGGFAWIFFSRGTPSGAEASPGTTPPPPPHILIHQQVPPLLHAKRRPLLGGSRSGGSTCENFSRGTPSGAVYSPRDDP